MNRKTIFKGIALLNFIVLITVFLLYRNGSFDRYIYGANERNLTSPNGGTPAKVSKDSTSKKNDSLEYLRMASLKKNDSLKSLRMASSKSIIIVDERKLITDNIQLFDSTKISLHPEEKRLMYSSKSGKIIEPKLFPLDSSKVKQIKLTKKNK